MVADEPCAIYHAIVSLLFFEFLTGRAFSFSEIDATPNAGLTRRAFLTPLHEKSLAITFVIARL